VYKSLYRIVLGGTAATVTVSYRVFPRIPPHSRSRSRKSLFFLNLVSGFEPGGSCERRASSEYRQAASASAASYGGYSVGSAALPLPACHRFVGPFKALANSRNRSAYRVTAVGSPYSSGRVRAASPAEPNRRSQGFAIPCSALGIPCSPEIFPCSREQGIRFQLPGMTGEFRRFRTPRRPNSAKFPVSSLQIRERPQRRVRSSLPPPPLSLPERRLSATPDVPSEKCPRFRGVLGVRLCAGEPETEGSGLNSGGSARLSLLASWAVPLRNSDRRGSERNLGEQSWLHNSRSAVPFHVRRLGAPRALLSRTQAAPVAPPSPAVGRSASSALVS
jgi:hypothetical protein